MFSREKFHYDIDRGSIGENLCLKLFQNMNNVVKVEDLRDDEFYQKKDIDSCRRFIDAAENYEPQKFNSYPELKEATKNQLNTCITKGHEILDLLEKGEADSQSINLIIEEIDLSMLAYLRNQNFALEDTNNKYFSFFLWLLGTIIVGGVILIYLNILEIKKKNLIIYNSEQFIKHSM